MGSRDVELIYMIDPTIIKFNQVLSCFYLASKNVADNQKHSLTGVTSIEVYVRDVIERRFEKVKNGHIFC
jgi:hypothetical protein